MYQQGALITMIVLGVSRWGCSDYLNWQVVSY